MRHDVDAVWDPMQKELFNKQAKVEEEALVLYKKSPEKAAEFLTGYTNKWGDKVVKEAWGLGDFLWTKYDELF